MLTIPTEMTKMPVCALYDGTFVLPSITILPSIDMTTLCFAAAGSSAVSKKDI
jgi:hypothetical protein